MQKDIFHLCKSIWETISLNLSNTFNVYTLILRTVRSLRDFIRNAIFVLYEKCPVMGKLKKTVLNEVSKCYWIQWSDMAYLMEGIVVDRMNFILRNK